MPIFVCLDHTALQYTHMPAKPFALAKSPVLHLTRLACCRVGVPQWHASC
jgi:hypothetical protein